VKVALLGGRWDGDTVEVVGPLPEQLSRLALSIKEMEALPEGKSDVPTVEYRKTQRTRADGCALYVLKGASL
jgi:hypothetical protein